jgi:hypothetical protein
MGLSDTKCLVDTIMESTQFSLDTTKAKKGKSKGKKKKAEVDKIDDDIVQEI